MTQDETRWISIEDELPEEGVQVLIYSRWRDDNGLIHIVSPRRAIYCGKCGGKGHWTSLSSWDYKPTHYMPLPAPPEVDDE